MSTGSVIETGNHAATPAPAQSQIEVIYRHGFVVRIAHWINLTALLLLLMSGLQIFNAYPRLHFGAFGADADKAWLEISAEKTDTPDARGYVSVAGQRITTTGVLGLSRSADGDLVKRGFPRWVTLPGDQDLAAGRHWHFLMAWVFVINGLIYLVSGFINGHLRRDLAPAREELRPRHLWRDILDHLRLKHPQGEAAKRYNTLQKLSYLAVIFVLLPGMFLTGLTMSPGVNAVAPWLLDLFGGRPTARSIHFITANLIVLFVIVHVAEVFLVGVVNEVGSMITGRYAIKTPIGGGKGAGA